MLLQAHGARPGSEIEQARSVVMWATLWPGPGVDIPWRWSWGMSGGPGWYWACGALASLGAEGDRCEIQFLAKLTRPMGPPLP